jgi:hypothetical protein
VHELPGAALRRKMLMTLSVIGCGPSIPATRAV